MIAFKNAVKSYGSRTVISIPDLELANGIYWVKGRNGSGKTTFLRMLAGLIPFSGDIFSDGTSLKTKPRTYRKNIGWAEAEPLYPEFISGREILNFYRQIYREHPDRADKLIDAFGVREYLSTQTGSWSDGMEKRLSLLLAFIGTPAVILLDEPLATLDAEAQQFLPSFLTSWYASNSCTILFSSHQSLSAFLLPEIKTISIQESNLSVVS